MDKKSKKIINVVANAGIVVSNIGMNISATLAEQIDSNDLNGEDTSVITSNEVNSEEVLTGSTTEDELIKAYEEASKAEKEAKKTYDDAKAEREAAEKLAVEKELAEQQKVAEYNKLNQSKTEKSQTITKDEENIKTLTAQQKTEEASIEAKNKEIQSLKDSISDASKDIEGTLANAVKKAQFAVDHGVVGFYEYLASNKNIDSSKASEAENTLDTLKFVLEHGVGRNKSKLASITSENNEISKLTFTDGSSFSLDSVKVSIDMIKAINEKRVSQGLDAWKITTSSMLDGEADADIESQKYEHVGGWENLAQKTENMTTDGVNYITQKEATDIAVNWAIDAWYNKEKAIYDYCTNHANEMGLSEVTQETVTEYIKTITDRKQLYELGKAIEDETGYKFAESELDYTHYDYNNTDYYYFDTSVFQVGHYLNIVDPDSKTTGAGIYQNIISESYSNGQTSKFYQTTLNQEFYWNRDGSWSIEDYSKIFDDYYTSVMDDLSKAKKAVEDAKQDIEDGEVAVAEAETELEKTKTALKTAQDKLSDDTAELAELEQAVTAAYTVVLQAKQETRETAQAYQTKKGAEDSAKEAYESACNNKQSAIKALEDSNVHIFTDWVTVTNPTCTTDGVKQKECENCHTTIDDRIPATGHKYSAEWTIDVKPTCTTDGIQSKHCENENCDSKTEEKISALGHNLTHFDRKEATTKTLGNIEYWYCTQCTNYYGDSSALNSVNLDSIVLNKLAPSITNGNNQTVVDKQAVSFTSNASYDDFVEIKVDGTTLDKSKYTVFNEDTLVTLNADYVSTLGAGTHTVNIVSSSGTATAQFVVEKKAETITFIDVDSSTDHNTAIMWLAGTGISKGWSVPNGLEFRPYATVKRCDMSAFLKRLGGVLGDKTISSYTPSNWNRFVDVAKGDGIHEEDILWLADNEISTGWEDGTFRPLNDVTRADMAAFLRRLAKKYNIGDAATWTPSESDWATFSDLTRGDDYHQADILWLAHAGISQGWLVEDGTKEFRPMETVKRCDMAAFLQRLADLASK